MPHTHYGLRTQLPHPKERRKWVRMGRDNFTLNAGFDQDLKICDSLVPLLLTTYIQTINMSCCLYLQHILHIFLLLSLSLTHFSPSRQQLSGLQLMVLRDLSGTTYVPLYSVIHTAVKKIV